MEKTLLKNIKKLRPGEYLTIENNVLQLDSLPEKTFKIDATHDENYWIATTEKVLFDSVKRHLAADVPIGINLSGGIDSSLITAMASKVSNDSVKTFCMGFGEEEDETQDARAVSDHYNTEHRDLLVKARLTKDYPHMIWFADTPKRNLYPYYLHELTSKYVKVALGGLGGDELFGGYTWKYEYANRIEEARTKLSQDKRDNYSKFAAELLNYQTYYGHIDDDRYIEYLKKIKYFDNDLRLYLEIQTLDEVFDKEYLGKIYGQKLMNKNLEDISKYYGKYYDNEHSFLENILRLDYQIKMKDDFIFIDESMAMANSLEGRIPFLDKEVVDLSFRMPFEMKYKNGIGKYVLKKLAQNYLPKEVLHKPKKGFGSNVFVTFNEELKDICSKAFDSGNIVKEGFIKKEYLESILKRPSQEELIKHYAVMWSLLAFEVWYNIYIESDEVKMPKKNIEYYICT
jgi:asparagine synthase (glutamine-hydrolysing)